MCLFKKLSLAMILVCLSSCSTVQDFFNLGADDTEGRETEVSTANQKTGDRAPSSINQNPLRVSEYCAVDNFSRVIDCYPTLELCQRAARGFAMCSGR